MIQPRRPLLMAASLILLAALAGCTTGEESLEQPATVVIDGHVYECDDTINLDERCQDYDLVEDEEPVGDEPAFESEDEFVLIDGLAYECVENTQFELEEQEGPCEEYSIHEEI